MGSFFKISFLSIASFFLFYSAVTAQIAGVSTGELVLYPEHPKPNELVSATLESYVADLNSADIVWLVNGNVVKQGKGLKSFSFKAGVAGTVTTVEVIATTIDGWPINKIRKIKPAEVSLVYEPVSYTHPFYKGKSFYSYQGKVKVIAIADFVDENGKKINPDNLIYLWTEGDRVASESSGYGKNTFVFTGGVPFRPNSINVEVSTPDKGYKAVANIDISPTEPKVIFYESSPEYGILFNKALGENINLTVEEMTVSAVPYFFDAKNRKDFDMKYEWNLNGQPVVETKPDIVLRKIGETEGLAIISLQTTNVNKIYQFANNTLNVSLVRGSRGTNSFNQN